MIPSLDVINHNVDYWFYVILGTTIPQDCKNKNKKSCNDFTQKIFSHDEFQQDLYKHKLQETTVEKPRKNNVTKVYCSKCDLIFESREKFNRHFDTHYSNVSCETCPVDSVIAKFVNLFRRKSHNNLE